MYTAWKNAFTGRWPMTVRWMLLSGGFAVAIVGIPWLLLYYRMLEQHGPTVGGAIGAAIVVAGVVGALVAAAVVAVICLFDARTAFDTIFIDNTDGAPVLTGVRRNGIREHADLS